MVYFVISATFYKKETILKWIAKYKINSYVDTEVEHFFTWILRNQIISN